MKLKQLECIAAVARSGYNVTAAAEKLHMSQPAVSKHIKLAEELLGLPIFRRNSKTFVGLTEVGEAIMPALMDAYHAGVRAGDDRAALLRRLAYVPGLYVPALYVPSYDGAGNLAALVPRRRASTASVYNQKNSFHSFFSPPLLPKATSPDRGKKWRSPTL